MKPLFQAIYTKYSGSSLPASLTGGLHCIEAPMGTSTPYGVYSMPSGVTDFTFDTHFENILIQFDIYADTNSAVQDLCEAWKTVFDDCQLTVTGFDFHKMEREFMMPMSNAEEFYYRYMLQYRILLHQ